MLIAFKSYSISKEEHLHKITTTYSKAFNMVYNDKKELSSVILEDFLTTGNIKNRLFNFEKLPLEMQNYLREVTYKELLQRYNQYKRTGIRQIHIHLKDNTSFLRMHAPKLYGDNLTKIRPTVNFVNKNKTEIDTFEEGKLQYGLRFVYPIFRDETHIGSIEISFSALAFTKSLMQEYNVLSNFFINKKNSDLKNAKEYQSNYISSHHKGSYLDSEIVKELQKVTKKGFKDIVPNENIIEKVRNIGTSKKPGSIYLANKKAIVTVIPIINKLTNKNIAFLTIRSKDDVIGSSKLTSSFISLAIIVILFLLLYNYFIIISRSKLFKSMLHSSSDQIFIMDLDGNLIDCSIKASKMLGYDIETMKTLNITHWDKSITQNEFKEFALTLNNEAVIFNRVYTKRNGFTYDAEISANILEIAGKRVVYYSARDISEKNKILQILDFERNKYKNILELSSEGIHIIDKKGRLVEFSKTFSENLGYTSEELETLTIFDWDVGIPKNELEKTIVNLIEKPRIFETKHKRKDGTIIYVQISAKGIEIEGEKLLYSSQRDITELKSKEREISAINKQQKSLLSLFEKGDSVLFKWRNDESWSIEYVSTNVINLLEYTKEEFMSKNILYSNCIYEEDLKEVENEVKSKVATNEDFFKHTPYRVVTKSGQIKWVLDYTVTERNISGEIEFFIGYLIDISEHENLITNLEKFADTQESIIILSNGVNISFANKKFHTFFGYDSLKDFNKNYKCICELFLENDKFFHLGKVNNVNEWMNEIEKLPENKRVVSMLSKNFELYAFYVNINRFDKNLLIVTFTDITQTMLEQIALEDKLIHDKLTGAYNREYFEKNYNRLLNKYESDGYLALAFIDIDYFKKVNDTYGHDVGDEVLIKFVETINKHSRQNDILIRWGGEEFILILKLKNIDDLEKPLQFIRKTIANTKFKTVEQITCSIGASIHKKDENIETTIKRADEAVYEAKTQGRNKVIVNID